jgi:tRNA uridine 5-carboxymethylaminomethyl modification enzyme
MFTSRAEYRIALRQDNADQRLAPKAFAYGAGDPKAWNRLQIKLEKIALAKTFLQNTREGEVTLWQLLKRPEVKFGELGQKATDYEREAGEELGEVIEQLEIEAKYQGYMNRQTAEIARFRKLESEPIPEFFDYTRIKQLRAEAREKLAQYRPKSLGQASRIPGITPADITLVLIHLG